MANLSSPESRVARLKEVGKTFVDPWKIACEAISDDTIIPIDQGVDWDPRPHYRPGKRNGYSWNGRVTIAGDAAHNM